MAKNRKKTTKEKQIKEKRKLTFQISKQVLRWLAILPFAFFAFVFTFLMGGYEFTAMVCMGIIAIITFYNCVPLVAKRFPKTAKVVKRIVTVCLCIGLLIAAITECVIIHASFGNPKESCEYIVVLGAKVREDGPSSSLMDRIRGAYNYLSAHPESIAVVAGGQGDDEPMTEAQCMRNVLVSMGIDESRIWMEGKSTSTWENLNFSLNLIEEKTGVRPSKIGVVSSEYHLFRTSLFADACNVEFVGIPAATSRFSQRVNHFMREIAGVWHYILLGRQYES